MTMKVLNSCSVQRVTFGLLKLCAFLRVYLLNKLMADSNNLSMCTQNQEQRKTNKQIKAA